MSERFSQVVGTGSYLPGAPVDNHAVARRLAADGIETSDAWIRERTGIAQRYIAPDDLFTSDLAAEDARRALADAACLPPRWTSSSLPPPPRT